MSNSSLVPLDCRLCKVRMEGVCNAVGAEHVAALNLLKGGVRGIPAGSYLFDQGDALEFVFILHHGWTYTYLLLEDGRRQIIEFWLPGSVLGFLPAETDRAPFGCQSLTDVVVCSLPRRQLHRVIQENPDYGMGLASATKRDEILISDHLASIGRRSARERVAHLLLELFCRARRRMPELSGDEVVLPLTQPLIADAMGLTSIHVSRTLSKLRRDGIVMFKDRALRIMDPDKLSEVAGLDGEIAEQWIRGPVDSPMLTMARKRLARR